MSVPPPTCPSCGALGKPGDRFCENCGLAIPMQMAPLPAVDDFYPGTDPLLTWTVKYPESLSRWKIFVKLFLAIPHFIVLYFLAIASAIVTLIAGVAVLFMGSYPRGLFDFQLLILRWSANVTAYVELQRDEYPPFGEQPFPATLSLAYPDHISHWKVLIKWLLVIPSAFVWSFVAIAALVAVVLAWFCILITGRMPRGLFDFITGANQWGYRITAYSNLMTDRYPPFSLR